MTAQLIHSGGIMQTLELAQVVYLDFDGESTAYNGEILTVDDVEVQNSNLTQDRIQQITAALNEQFATQNVQFVLERPASGEYSTVYIGKNSSFDSYGTFAGLAETVDPGNQKKNDNAFVMLDSRSSNEQIVNVIAHETGHLLGILDHGGSGLQKYAKNQRYDVSCGIVSSGIILEYDSMYVHSGGTAMETTVNGNFWYYGCLHVSSGGSATNTTVNFMGCLYVSSGGSAINTAVNSRGGLYVSSGGMVTNTTINDGGFILLSSGGFAAKNTVNGGYLCLSNGGVADNSTVNTGYLYISSGGTANSTTVNLGYLSVECGKVMNTTINSDGRLYIENGGIANSTVVNSCGFLNVSSGGTAMDTTVNSGGYLYVYRGGTAKNTTVNSNGYLRVSSCGTANSVIVNASGCLNVSSGGTASDTTVNPGGYCGIWNTGVLTGYLRAGGTVEAENAASFAGLSELHFHLFRQGDDACLTVISGDLASTLPITVDVTQAYGQYTLVSSGAGNITSVSVTSTGGENKVLSVNSSVSFADGRSVSLSVVDSACIMNIEVNDTTPPGTPGNIQSELVENQLSLSWDKVTDLTGVTYEIEYSKDHTFTGSVYSKEYLNNQAELSLGNGTWYWRIRAVDGAGNYSSWSTVSNAVVDHTDILEGAFTSTRTYCGDLIIKPTADGVCGYPACVQIMSPECVVTVEGGSLACDSVRNAAILFGEDAYWVNYYGYGDHYDGTVTFTGATASLSSKVSYCIIAAGIVGKNLTVNFTGNANKSSGISFHAGQGTGAGNEAAAILADEDLVINGTFGGTAVSLFDFSLLADERWATAEGFGAEGSITVNGGISGTVLSFAYAPTSSAYGYGLKAGYSQSLTVSETISGTIAAFGKSTAYALYGGKIEASVDGVLIAGTAEAGTSEDELLALIHDTEKNRAKLIQLSSGCNAVYANYGTGTFSVGSNAEIFGGIQISSGTVNADSGAFISGSVKAASLAITLNAFSSESVFQQGWSTGTAATIRTDHAQNGVYHIADNLAAGKNITVVCGKESKTWSWQNNAVLEFSGGETFTFSYANKTLDITVSGLQTVSAKSDLDGNGISDVMFQYTGGDNQIGFWMNGKSTWQATGAAQPDNWELLGNYDMDANGKADQVMFGNVLDGAYIGYYKDGDTTASGWQNIGYLSNPDGIEWRNAVGNLTGNAGKNSIVWHAPTLGALGIWTDGTDNWVGISGSFDANWEMQGCGDFTGDGKDEILWQYNGALYTTDINGNFASLGGWGIAWEVRAIGDFSNDGKDDIVLFHKETGSVVKFTDGLAENWSSLGQLDASDWFIVGAGDYNNDQKDDLLVRQYSTGMLGYYSAGDMSQWNEMGRGVDMNWAVIA